MTKATEMLANMGFSGKAQAPRVAKLAAVLAKHPDAQLERCSDEATGHRYGQAAKRVGRCEKIGSTTYQYQLWAVWGTMNYMVMTASAKMPNSCWGVYRRCAVVQVDMDALPEGRVVPAMISERARGVVCIVETWESLNCGTTDRCAYAVALREAEALADELNDPTGELAKQRAVAHDQYLETVQK